jgi:hypothetical protein
MTSAQVPAKDFRSLTVREQVQQAMPLAQSILADGISGERKSATPPLLERVIELLDDRDLDRMVDDGGHNDEVVALERRIEAAYALGIAIGLLLSPEGFGIGGVR